MTETTYSTVPQPRGKVATKQTVVGDVCPSATDPNLVIHEFIGKGQLGVVYRAEWHSREVAVKFLNDILLLESYDKDSRKEGLLKLHRGYLDLMMESTTMMSIGPHTNVIGYVGITGAARPVSRQQSNERFRSIFGDREFDIGIMTKFIPGSTSLEEKLGVSLNPYSLKNLKRISKGVADGMAHIHRADVIHGDLAARNVLVSGDKAMITDFGLAKLIWKSCQSLYYEAKPGDANVPLKLMPPEFFKSSVDRTWGFGKPLDVWAYGLLIYSLYNNGERDAFPGIRRMDYAKKLQYDEPFPAELVFQKRNSLTRIARLCLMLEQEHRPTFEQISGFIYEMRSLKSFEDAHLEAGITVVKIPERTKSKGRFESGSSEQESSTECMIAW